MEEKHYTQRKTPRAYFHNYDAGTYFITICTAFKKHYFGEIYHDKMALSPIGEYCKMQWEQLTTHYPYATVPLFVVMPNHVHALVCNIAGNDFPQACSPLLGRGRGRLPMRRMWGHMAHTSTQTRS